MCGASHKHTRTQADSLLQAALSRFSEADGKFVFNIIGLILKSWWFSAGEVFQRLLRFVMRYCQIRQRFQEFEAGLVEYNY